MTEETFATKLEIAIAIERQRCAQIVIDCFAPDQGESVHPDAIEALRLIRSPEAKHEPV